MTGRSGCTSLRRKGVKEIHEHVEEVIDVIERAMVIVQGGGDGLLWYGNKYECLLPAIVSALFGQIK
ncbi:hypothetical protein FHG87_016772 [Trinorchestia longiramus]|nr:hypothetical protein FHG87_016772 [Trinorchestia longiramus]